MNENKKIIKDDKIVALYEFYEDLSGEDERKVCDGDYIKIVTDYINAVRVFKI
ncbi:MAG: hypothetical protein ACLSWT_07595 [Clostridia bacterium]|uniref:hypothetical protein n=1 Tax=Terrisporobacter sp. TaxID=1965305 RepID=UPI0039944DD1